MPETLELKRAQSHASRELYSHGQIGLCDRNGQGHGAGLADPRYGRDGLGIPPGRTYIQNAPPLSGLAIEVNGWRTARRHQWRGCHIGPGGKSNAGATGDLQMLYFSHRYAAMLQ